MQSERFDIVIGGGSFVGVAIALSLAKSAPGAFRIAIVERMPVETAKSGAFDGRSVALTAAAKQMLEALDVWDSIAADAQPVHSIDITDSELDMPVRSVLLNFDNAPDEDGPTAYILENALLRRALYSAVADISDISFYSPATIDSIDLGEAMASATLSTGETLKTSLIVAADGQRSGLRDMAGIKIVEWTSDQAAIVGTVAHEKPHHGCAIQHFLPAGPFAILPMTDNRSSLVWTERKDEADRITALSEEHALAEIDKRMGGRFGSLSLVGTLARYPLKMTLARDFVKPRFALAGDAAHGLHWIAGQGLNHGLKDAAALAEVLVDAARLGLDPGDLVTLQRYERWRRFDSTTAAMTAAALNRFFANDLRPLRMVRQFGLGLVDKLPLVKNAFRREAAGLTGEVPKLLRGQRL